MLIELTEFLSSNASPVLIRIFQIITIFAESYVSVVVIGLIYWCFDKRHGQYIALTVCASLGFNGFFKNLFCRTRPFDVSDRVVNWRESTATGYSFPSGHTQNASILGGTLSVIIQKRVVTGLFIAYSLLVGFSRLLLGAHYIDDVAVSLILGWGLSIISAVIFDKNNERKDNMWMLWYLIPMVLCAIPLFRSIAQLPDAVNSIGLSIGIIGGFIIENRYINFSVAQGVRNRVARFVIGILLTLGTLFGLKLLPQSIAIRIVRYALVGLIATAGAPYIFKKLKI